MLPRKIKKEKVRQSDRIRCPGHLAWVRKFACCVSGCNAGPIEAAHVRVGTDGGMGMKPSDSWVISLCHAHHLMQHVTGEIYFERAWNLDMKKLAQEFAAKSPPLQRYLKRQKRAAA